MHHLYTKEGVAEVLGLPDPSKVNRLIKRAEKLGLKPSITKMSTEYFDIDLLENPYWFIDEENKQQSDDMKVIIQRQIESRDGHKRLQLCLFDFSDE